jgi:uncharacterized membrane protein YtjA (UPF0391 family)
MIGWIVTLLILAAIAAIFGFGGIATAFASIAQILFYILLVAVVIFIIAALVTGKKIFT